ncbi:MAG: DUF5069 domain-containing protein [Opitutaceae bacterium]|nr:DUF5069 domain-containing protein [Opitutaceae bacterium]
MPSVPGLRSPYDKVGRLMYFGRMLDKIRLYARGALPADYHTNLGKAFDGRCCNFLRVSYDELKTCVLSTPMPDDTSVLAWVEARGGARSDEDCEIWNGFMMKRGWRDPAAEILVKRIAESALHGAPIMTMFDYLDFDEGRDPVAARRWEA